MTATSPVASVPVGDLWGGVAGATGAGASVVQSQSNEPGVWLVDLGAQGSATPAPPGIGMLGSMPIGSPGMPDDPVSTAPSLAVSDRGWIGEPTDSIAPNTPYMPRLAEAPTLERSLPIWPDAGRRLSVSAGEIHLFNGDGTLDTIAGDWAAAGQTVTIRRGPHRRPLHAPMTEFVTIATLRAAGAAVGTSRLSIPLRPPAADLSVPVCTAYLGTGGMEGVAALTGQFKPRLYGRKRNVEPVLIDPGQLLYHVNDGPVQAISAVRDRGAALTNAGDLANYTALAAASVSAGTFKTCLAIGAFRTGSIPSSLTIDAQGDNDAGTGGYNSGTAAGIAYKLLTGPGGISGVDGAAFSWAADEAGLLLRGGTVTNALDALAAGVFGWWGCDETGSYEGGQIDNPTTADPALGIEPSMLAAPPEEIGPPRAPVWRVRIGYQALCRVQTDEQLAGSVSATDRAYYGAGWQTAVASDTDISAAYPLADDAPEIVSVFDAATGAQSIADQMLALFGVPRRMFRATIRAGAGGYLWPTLTLGACVTLRWPQHTALAAGRSMIVVGVSTRGDAVTLTLWG